MQGKVTGFVKEYEGKSLEASSNASFSSIVSDPSFLCTFNELFVSVLESPKEQDVINNFSDWVEFFVRTEELLKTKKTDIDLNIEVNKPESRSIKIQNCPPVLRPLEKRVSLQTGEKIQRAGVIPRKTPTTRKEQTVKETPVVNRVPIVKETPVVRAEPPRRRRRVIPEESKYEIYSYEFDDNNETFIGFLIIDKQGGGRTREMDSVKEAEYNFWALGKKEVKGYFIQDNQKNRENIFQATGLSEKDIK